MTEIDRQDRLEMAVDEQLIALREDMRDYNDGDWNAQVVAAFMRAAWARGVCDSLRDPQRMRALIESLGYHAA